MDINCEIDFFARDIFAVLKYHERLVWRDNDQFCLNYIKYMREPEFLARPKSLQQLASVLKINWNVKILLLDNEFALDAIKAEENTQNINGDLLSVVKNSKINEMLLVLKNDCIKPCAVKKLTKLTLIQDDCKIDSYNNAIMNIFESIPNIEKLCLINISISDEIFPHLTNLITNNKKLKDLTLSNTCSYSKWGGYNILVLTKFLCDSNLNTLRLLESVTDDCTMGVLYESLMCENRFPKNLRKLVIGLRDAKDLLSQTKHIKVIKVEKLVIQYYNNGDIDDVDAIYTFIDKHTEAKYIKIKEIWCIRSSCELTQREKLKRLINFGELKARLCANSIIPKITFVKDYAA